MIDLLLIIAVTIVLFVSFCICNISKYLKPHSTFYSYLYEGNKTFLSISSNVGTIFSLSVFLGTIISGAYLFGSRPIILLFLTFIPSYALIVYLTFKKAIKQYFYESHNEEDLKIPSLIGFIGSRFGSRTQFSLDLLASIYLLAVLVIELAIARLLFSYLFPSLPINPNIITFLIVLICLMYVYIGGYVGVLNTDVFQLIIIVVFFIYLFISFKYINFSDLVNVYNQNAISNPLYPLIAAVILALAWFTSSLDVWFRNIITLKSARKSRKAVLASIIPTLILFCLPFFIGLYARKKVPESIESFKAPFEVLKYFLDKIEFSYLGYGLIFAAITCAAITTIDTHLITVGQSFFAWALRKRLISKSSDSKIDTRSIILLFCIISSLISLFFTYENYATLAVVLISPLIYIFLLFMWATFFNRFCDDFIAFLASIGGLILSIGYMIYMKPRIDFFGLEFTAKIPLIYTISFVVSLIIAATLINPIRIYVMKRRQNIIN